MICIKTGMANEYAIAKKYASPDTLVLTGIQTVDDLEKRVPKDCQAIMSFGMCGGLRPELPIVGQTVIASWLIGPDGDAYQASQFWHQRLFDRTRFYVQPYYSSGQFNQANTPAQRAAIYQKTGAWCIDDESLWVARFAKQRDILFAIMRNVSDAWDDDVSVTSNLLNADGGVNPMAVFADLVEHPSDMVKIFAHYEVSQRHLELAASMVGPAFGWL